MLSLLLALACATPDDAAPDAGPAAVPAPAAAPTPVAPPPAAATVADLGTAPTTPAEQAAVAAARAAAKAMGGALKGELKAAIAEGGPGNGIAVCNERAPQVAAQVAADSGVTIGRSSLRLRNPENAGPPWVQAWLQATGERKAEGLAPQAGIVEVDGARVAHLVVPMQVEALCVACHGPADGLAADVATALAERYPKDAATGYAVGDLRGVLWVEAPVEQGAAAAVGAEAGG